MGGGEPPTKFSEREGGLTGPQVLEGGLVRKRGWLFSGWWGCKFYIKDKVSDKESLKTNSKWEILTKNLVTFKR